MLEYTVTWTTRTGSDLGWRMTDAWLSMAGAGSVGKPNGVPVDEWGIRMEKVLVIQLVLT